MTMQRDDILKMLRQSMTLQRQRDAGSFPHGGTGGQPLPIGGIGRPFSEQARLSLGHVGDDLRTTNDTSPIGATGRLAQRLTENPLGGTGGQPLPQGGVGSPVGVAVGPEDDEAQLALEAARIAAGVSPLGSTGPRNVQVFGGETGIGGIGGASLPRGGIGRRVDPRGRRDVFNRLGEDTFR